jgi:ADP-heptose:LPS heptosyltransferase
MLSLPLAMKTFSEAEIPGVVPYLIADEQKKAGWASRLATERRHTVGLAWRGRSTHKNDRNRSIPLEMLKPLLSHGEIQFVTLQKDLTDAESRELARHDNVMVLDRELESFDETAAIVSVVDLMISVDSSPAHLSGALNKATWVLLAFSPDWRWQLRRNDSPWYPSARLFRQQSIGDWTCVIDAVAAALRVQWTS